MSRFSHHALAGTVFLALASASSVMAQDAHWNIANDSNLTLMELYASPVSTPNWSNDILGSTAIGPGETGTITVTNGQTHCLYDFQLVMEDGSVLDRRTNICEEESMTLR